MSDISWRENVLNINDKKIVLDFDILEIREVNDIVLVVTVPQDKVLDNLFGISINTGEMWKVQKLNEVYPNFSQTPYVGVSIANNEVLVTDFCGCRFIVNSTNGKIIGRAIEVR